jgi:hypothetical protein
MRDIGVENAKEVPVYRMRKRGVQNAKEVYRYVAIAFDQ